MKIFPLKPLSQLDKFNNLIKIIQEAPAPSQNNVEKNVTIINSKFSISELRSIYKQGLKRLNRDKFEK